MSKRFITLFSLLVCIGLGAAEKSKIEKTDGIIEPSARLELPVNYVRADTDLKVTVESKKFQPFAFGRGNDKLYRSNWVEITETEVVYYDVVLVNKALQEDANLEGSSAKTTARVREKKEIRRYEHGLNFKKIKKFTARLDVQHETATLYIETPKGNYETVIKSWFGGGEPFIENLGASAFRANLEFTRKTADASLWIIGASYFNSFSPGRWPYYMRKEGNDDWMGDHLPGGNSVQLLPCFIHDLEFGTPNTCIWLAYGNDKADKDVVDPTWLKNTLKFIEICKEKGIEPVLAIYPFLPKKNHSKKAEWVRQSGYRYIDLYEMMCNPDGSWKDPAWLANDKVHPSNTGAKVMWEGIKKQLPDLFK